MQLRKYLQASLDARISLTISSYWEKHDENLRGVLQRFQQHDVRLKKEKFSVSKSEIKFYGHIFSKDRIKEITDMSKLENVSEVKSLLGMAQYMPRYIPDYATITAPVRLLTKHKMLGSGPTRATSIRQVERHPHQESYDVTSPVRLGGLLMQDRKVISYASRALSDVEHRYWGSSTVTRQN